MTATTWQGVAAQLAQIGLPSLGRILGGNIPIIGSIFGGTIGEQAGTMVATIIAKALGVEATPEAVSQAIESGETTEVVATLKAVEAEAAVRWPALANIEESERKAEVEIAKINAESAKASAESTDRIAEDLGTNGFWLSLYRSIMMYTATGNLFFFGFLFFYGLIIDPAMWKRLVDGYVIVSWWIGAMGTILGAHFFARASERKAAVQAPAAAAAASATAAANAALARK